MTNSTEDIFDFQAYLLSDELAELRDFAHIQNKTNSTDDTFDFQAFLQSDELAELRDNQKVARIIYSVSASISIIGSAATIFHILRTHKGLSSTYHRLVFGLCVGDLMASFAWALNTTAVPKEMQYFNPNARGNVETCTAQGFINTVGVAMASSYNSMICFYYLSIITFNKKDEYIKRNLEPWFHGIPIVTAVVFGTTGVIMKQFNNTGVGGQCHITNYHPPHCQGIANGIIPEGFTIPCGRGDTESGNLFKGIAYLVPLTITPAIIVGTMVIMYRTVRKIERKMQNYGAGALRLRARQHRQAQEVNDPTTSFIFFESVKIKLLSICPCVYPHHNASRSNNARSQKRAVLYMAMSYSLTWALTWIPVYIFLFVISSNVTRVMAAVLHPLQGLYTLIVYMSPKVRNARNTKRGKLPWFQAIAKAWMSKGEKDRAIVSRRYIKTSSLRPRLQSRLSQFMDRRSNRSSAAVTSSSKASTSVSPMIDPPSTIP